MAVSLGQHLVLVSNTHYRGNSEMTFSPSRGGVRVQVVAILIQSSHRTKRLTPHKQWLRAEINISSRIYLSFLTKIWQRLHVLFLSLNGEYPPKSEGKLFHHVIVFAITEFIIINKCKSLLVISATSSHQYMGNIFKKIKELKVKHFYGALCVCMCVCEQYTAHWQK